MCIINVLLLTSNNWGQSSIYNQKSSGDVSAEFLEFQKLPLDKLNETSTEEERKEED